MSGRGRPSLSALLTLSIASGSALAQDAQKPLVSTGDESMTLAEAQRRISELLPFQLGSLGQGSVSGREIFVREVLGLELCEAMEAKRLGLLESDAVRDRRRAILARALEKKLEGQVSESVTEEALRKFFEQHRKEFEEPAKVAAWRIVVADKQRAEAIIQAAQGKDGVTRWREIARNESLDRATHMRGGDLGFLREDGSTDTPQLRVDKRVYGALTRVEDGALVPEPLELDGKFAVLWRRGSLAPKVASFELERAFLHQHLVWQKTAEARDQLISKLRQEHLKEYRPELFEILEGRDIDTASAKPREETAQDPGQGEFVPPRPTPQGFR